MEPFPPLEEEEGMADGSPQRDDASRSPRRNTQAHRQSNPSLNRSRSTRLRSASAKFMESNPPSGAWMATGEIASRAPTLNEIRTGSFSSEGWTEEGQMERRGSTAREIQRRRTLRSNSAAARAAVQSTPPAQLEALRESMDIDRKKAEEAPRVSTDQKSPSEVDHATIPESKISAAGEEPEAATGKESASHPAVRIEPDETGTYPNGYRFPPKNTWQQSIVIGLKAFGSFVLTPFGFLVTIYCLNVVAWGAMIFFLLLNVAPAMCHPSCDAEFSARRIWIEIDSQILNALFCVTGFGLIPWRFRDFYYLMRWRVCNSHDSLRRLAGIHRAWFRLPGSDQLPEDIGPSPINLPTNSAEKLKTIVRSYTAEQVEGLECNRAVPLPITSIPPAPLTGARATPTRRWWLDAVIWLYMSNTALQACLSGLMWGMNRFERPSWAVGFIVALACLTGAFAGLIGFVQGRRIKRIEGIPVEEEEPKTKPDGTESAPDQTISHSQLEDGLVTRLVRRDSHWYRRH